MGIAPLVPKMPRWYNYLGAFSKDDYETFLSICEINPSSLVNEEGMKHLICEQFESNRINLMARLMIRKAIFRGDLTKKDDGYEYSGENFCSFVRAG